MNRISVALIKRIHIYVIDTDRVRIVFAGGAQAKALIIAGNPGTVPVVGDIYTVAGNGKQGFSGDGGAASSAEFYAPWGLAINSGGLVFISDTQNERIRKID